MKIRKWLGSMLWYSRPEPDISQGDLRVGNSSTPQPVMPTTDYSTQSRQPKDFFDHNQTVPNLTLLAEECDSTSPNGENAGYDPYDTCRLRRSKM